MHGPLNVKYIRSVFKMYSGNLMKISLKTFHQYQHKYTIEQFHLSSANQVYHLHTLWK
jgi:hypothetical protein